VLFTILRSTILTTFATNGKYQGTCTQGWPWPRTEKTWDWISSMQRWVGLGLFWSIDHLTSKFSFFPLIAVWPSVTWKGPWNGHFYMMEIKGSLSL
jgi:hypothetical protein